MVEHILQIATELGVKLHQVEAVSNLLAEGGTVPFIARYRKEATGSLDEVAIETRTGRHSQFEELDKRREALFESLTEYGKLTDVLKEKLLAAGTMAKLEDIYLPYRPKRRTRATIAKEKGLESLALKILEQSDFDPLAEAQSYISEEKDVKTAEDALDGARDIIAEIINEDEQVREKMRELYNQKSVFVTKVLKDKEQEAIKYKDYFDRSEPVAKAPSHRILAVRRGAKEKMLSMRNEAPFEEAIGLIEEIFI